MTSFSRQVTTAFHNRMESKITRKMSKLGMVESSSNMEHWRHPVDADSIMLP